MGILIIDSKPENLEYYKKTIGEENNHFVAGLNDSLMLLETIYEFDLAICNYKLEDATGKDLHENFRMLPETENVPIIFILDVPDDSIESKVKNMSMADILISPDENELMQKVKSMMGATEDDINPNDFDDEESTAVVDNQVDFATLMNEVNSDEEPEDNQVDFDSLMDEVNDEPEKAKDDNQVDFESLMDEAEEEKEEKEQENDEDNQIDFESLMNEVNAPSDKEDYDSAKSKYDNKEELSPKMSLNELSESTSFYGNIETTPFSDILMHIMEHNYTARILLKNEISEEECDIKIENKHIVEIEMEDFDVEDTLFWVLNWDTANVEISLIKEVENKNCEIPIEEIVEDVIDKRNEFEELSETLPDLDTILVQTSTYDSNLSDFEEEYKRIIDLFDGVNSINDVLSLIEEDNIYTLTIISQLYMDEILILPEEKKINKQEEIIPDKEEATEEEHYIEEDDDLLSSYLTEEDEEEEDEYEEELTINAGILESDENFEEIDKDKYIDELLESFKDEEEIIITPKASPFKVASIALFIINFVLTLFIFIYKSPPKKITINKIDKHENIIKKINLYNLGLENKVKYVRNNIDIVNEILKQRIFKQKRKIIYENALKSKKYGLMIKKADFYVLKGNYKKAIVLYKKLLEKAPNQVSILLKLATAYYNDDDDKNSIKIIDKLNFLKDKSLNFIFLKAQVYQASNDLEESIKHYLEFLELSKDQKLKSDVSIIINNLSKKIKKVKKAQD